MWSKNSVLSDWVLDEAFEGKNKKILIPLIIDDLQFTDIPYGYRRLNSLIIFDKNDVIDVIDKKNYSLLIKSINKLLQSHGGNLTLLYTGVDKNQKIKLLPSEGPIEISVYENTKLIRKKITIQNIEESNIKIEKISTINNDRSLDLTSKQFIIFDAVQPIIHPNMEKSEIYFIIKNIDKMHKKNIKTYLQIYYRYLKNDKWISDSIVRELKVNVKPLREGVLLSVAIGNKFTYSSAIYEIEDDIIELKNYHKDNYETAITYPLQSNENIAIGTLPYIKYLDGDANSFYNFKNNIGIKIKYNCYKNHTVNELSPNIIIRDFLQKLLEDIQAQTGYTFLNYIFTYPLAFSDESINNFNRVLEKVIDDNKRFVLISEEFNKIYDLITKRNENKYIISYSIDEDVTNITLFYLRNINNT